MLLAEDARECGEFLRRSVKNAGQSPAGNGVITIE